LRTLGFMNRWTNQTSLLFSRQNGEDTRFYKQLYIYKKKLRYINIVICLGIDLYFGVKAQKKVITKLQ